MHSPPVDVWVVPPLDESPLDEPSPPVELDELSEPEVLSKVSPTDSPESVLAVLELPVDVEVPSPVAVAEVSELVGAPLSVAVSAEVADWPMVLDTESVPLGALLLVSVIEAAVVSPSPSPPQANRVRPTSTDSTPGAAGWTERREVAQKGQRDSVSHT
jgi:hypothetical protein